MGLRRKLGFVADALQSSSLFVGDELQCGELLQTLSMCLLFLAVAHKVFFIHLLLQVFPQILLGLHSVGKYVDGTVDTVYVSGLVARSHIIDSLVYEVLL